HEPGTTLECFVNTKALHALPQDLQDIVINACRVANQDMLAEFTARNNEALQTLVNKHHVKLRRFPDDVLKGLHETSDKVVAEIANKDPMSEKIYLSFKKFRDQAMAWHDISERAYLNASALRR
ncbi:MAG: ABC transporter substrate-binding protein, partial [Chromatiales bacterium]|nr:ABC transporter substrate-binding protein [Chromatiales bacterium]